MSSSCSSVRGLARFSRSSSLAAAIASSRTCLARLSASTALSFSPRGLCLLGVPAFSPRRTLSKNIWTSAPVGGSHVIVNADLLAASDVLASSSSSEAGSSDSTSDERSVDAASSSERSVFVRVFAFLEDLPSSGRYHSSTLALITALNASGLTTAKERSSISALAPNIPSCSAKEHHTWSVSLATNFDLAELTAYIVRMLCSLSAILIRKTLGSSTITRRSLRSFASSSSSMVPMSSVVDVSIRIWPAVFAAAYAASATSSSSFGPSPPAVSPPPGESPPGESPPGESPPPAARAAAAARRFISPSTLLRWYRRKICGNFPRVLTSCTSFATRLPNCALTSSTSHSVSSTTSWRMHAATASTYLRSPRSAARCGSSAARILAASTQWVTYGSPLRRYWPWCQRSAKSAARTIFGWRNIGYAEQSTPHSTMASSASGSSSGSLPNTSSLPTRSHSCDTRRRPATGKKIPAAASTASTLTWKPTAS